MKSSIFGVLKMVHPDTGMSAKAMTILNMMMNDFLVQISDNINCIVKENPEIEIDAEMVEAIILEMLPGALALHGKSEARKALTKLGRSLKDGEDLNDSDEDEDPALPDAILGPDDDNV
jgi:histone H2B